MTQWWKDNLMLVILALIIAIIVLFPSQEEQDISCDNTSLELYDELYQIKPRVELMWDYYSKQIKEVTDEY